MFSIKHHLTSSTGTFTLKRTGSFKDLILDRNIVEPDITETAAGHLSRPRLSDEAVKPVGQPLQFVLSRYNIDIRLVVLPSICSLFG